MDNVANEKLYKAEHSQQSIPEDSYYQTKQYTFFSSKAFSLCYDTQKLDLLAKPGNFLWSLQYANLQAEAILPNGPNNFLIMWTIY